MKPQTEPRPSGSACLPGVSQRSLTVAALSGSIVYARILAIGGHLGKSLHFYGAHPSIALVEGFRFLFGVLVSWKATIEHKATFGTFGGRIPAVSASHPSAQPFQQFAGLRQRRVRIDPRGVFLAALPDRRVVC